LVELTGRRKTGETFPLEACLSSWRGVDGFQYGAAMRDISARKHGADRMRHLAEHDTLTGLANRNRLYEHLGARLAEAKAQQTKVALVAARSRQVQAGQLTRSAMPPAISSCAPSPGASTRWWRMPAWSRA